MTPSTKDEKAKQRREQNLAKAIAHPLRSEILTILGRRKASPSELQEELPGAKLEDISYHTRRLVDLEVVEVVEETRVRGWNKTVYRATVRNFVTEEDAQAVHPAMADHYASQVWQEVTSAMKRAAEGGSLKTQENLHLTCDDTLVFDQQAWDEASELHDELEVALVELAADSAKRQNDSGEEGMRVASVQLLFKLPDADA
jgi:DNA-binding transcriptional ArsR family regulator